MAAARREDDLPSPSFVIRREALERNCQRIADKVRAAGLLIRPHVKTSKVPQIARMQLDALGDDRARGIVVSTLAEAEAMADHGFDDVTYGVPLGPHLVERALRLHRRIAHLRIVIDSAEQLEAVEAAWKAAAAVAVSGEFLQAASVFLALDCGYGREGVCVAGDRLDDAVLLAQRIAESGHAELFGVYSHSGNSYNTRDGREGAQAIATEEARLAAAAAAAIRAAGVPCDVVSVGSTPAVGALPSLAHEGVTEVHPGNYVFFDRQQLASGSCDSIEDVACHVLARVVAHYPARNELLLDAGGTALHKDSGGCEGWGVLRGFPSLAVVRMSQEVSIVGSVDGSPLPWTDLPLGAAVRIVPNHSCMTACMFPRFAVVSEAGEVCDEWTPVKFW